MLNSVTKIRLILGSGLFGVVFFLLWQGVVPLGEITYSSDLKDGNDFIGKLDPDTRIEDGGRRIIGDPVYFSLRTPRSFQSVELEILYRNEDFPLLEAGMLIDGDRWRYQTQPLENRIIDELLEDWHVLKENGLLLLQKQQGFQSKDDFLNNLPDFSEIAVYNYNLDREFILPDYKATSSSQTIDLDFRGSYEFYTYIKEEDLEFEFQVQDKNENEGPSPININLFFQGKLIDNEYLPDDGVVEAIGEKTPPRRVSLKTEDLPEGVYKIELKANDDIITRQISTSQQKLSFANQVRLAEEARSHEFYVTGRELSAQVSNPAYRQALVLDSEELPLTQAYKRFITKLDCHPCFLDTESGGLILSSDGVFSLSQEALIDPSINRVDANLDVEREGIEYILAEYTPPEKKGDYRLARARFDLSSAYKEDGEYGLMLSVPGLRAEDDSGQYIELEEIRVNLKGRNLWQKLFQP